MSKRRVDAAKAKVRRKQQMVIGLAVLFVGLLAFQLPKLMKGSKPAEPAPAATTAPDPAAPEGSTPVSTAPATVPSAPAQPIAVIADGGGEVRDPDPAPFPQEGQLVAFDLFKSKDPFVQQLDQNADAEADDASSEAAPPPAVAPEPTPAPAPASVPAPVPAPVTPVSPPAPAPVVTSPPVTDPPVTAPPATSPPATEPPATEPPVTPPPAPPPAPPPPVTEPPPAPLPATKPPAATQSVTLSVNGVSEPVQVGGTFPKSEPVFRLVSVKKGLARISVAGGSLQDGAPSVPLKEGQPLTLMNTADGTRYVLRLVSIP